MTTVTPSPILQLIRRIVEDQGMRSLPDQELLQRIVHQHDEATFHSVLCRHGPMVLDVCRGVLGNVADAEDAFQATFLVLIRKASSIRKTESLASWLHGVAYRIALKARLQSAARRKHECNAIDRQPASADDPSWQEVRKVVHEELSALPDRYRVPLVLCYLEGATQEAAANELKLAKSTLRERLERGRALLRTRLVRRGLGPAAVLVAAAWPAAKATATMPIPLVASTVNAATTVAAGGTMTSVVSTKVAALTEGMVRLMSVKKLKIAMTLVLGVALFGGAAGMLTRQHLSAQQKDTRQATTRPADKEADKVQPAKAKAAPEPSFDYTAPITVTGQVLDDQRKPIPGATVYLASVGAAPKRLAEAKSDDKGNYEFRDVKLPVHKARPGQLRDLGAFEVYGQAPGFGLGWKPQKWFYPDPPPAGFLDGPGAPDPNAEPRSYEAGDPITINLTLRPSTHIAGRIVDDRDRPIRQAKLRIVHCEPLAAGAESMLSSLATRESAPSGWNIRATNDEGRFDFSGLPPDCRFQILVQPKDYPQRWIWAATTSTPQPAYGRAPVLVGDLKLTFAAPVEVPIHVIFGDSQKPAVKVLVTLDGSDASAAKETDADGRVTLRVPAGEYHFSLMPARGTGYLETLDKLVVGKNAPAEPIVGKLRPAGIIEISVVDKDTGAAIEGVDFWLERADGIRDAYFYRWWDKPIAELVRPRSDKNGKLRVLIEPGKHRIGVGNETRADGLVVVESDGQEIESRPGKPIELKFTMQQR